MLHCPDSLTTDVPEIETPASSVIVQLMIWPVSTNSVVPVKASVGASLVFTKSSPKPSSSTVMFAKVSLIVVS